MFFPVVCWALSLFWLLLCFHTCGCFSQLKCDTWYSASNWLLFPFLRWMSWMMYELVCSCTSHVCVYVCVCAGFCPEDRSCFHRGQARPWWGAIRGVFQTTPHGRGACMELSEFQDHVIGHVTSRDWSCDQSWLVMWSVVIGHVIGHVISHLFFLCIGCTILTNLQNDRCFWRYVVGKQLQVGAT